MWVGLHSSMVEYFHGKEKVPGSIPGVSFHEIRGYSLIGRAHALQA